MMSDKLINLQTALDAFNYPDDACLSVAVIKAKLTELRGAEQVHSTEVAFWKERAEFYEKTCFDLISDINKGVKISSIEINENGIIFTKERKRSCDGCKHLGMWENEIEYGYPCPCLRCVRRVNDNYER